MSEASQPLVRKIGRRRLLQLAALGTGAVAATAATVAVWPHDGARVGPGAVPVKNPAFREAPPTPRGRHLLYCQTGDGSYVAYELNAAAFAIWDCCNGHGDFLNGSRRTVASVASSLSGRAGLEAVVGFIGELRAHGLVFLGDGRGRVYIPYQQVS